MSTAELVEHPLPRTATVKRMYGTAFRCGHSKCKRPLYRVNDADGEYTLNSTVAHIHARREKGPRWNPEMTGEENRSEDNLVLLCLEHSKEVDAIPDEYPADDMRAWKLVVRAEYEELRRSWELTDDQVAEVFAASFEVREFARTTVESESLTQCQRFGGTLIEQATATRRPVQALAAAWNELGDRYTREARAVDEKGELVRVLPPGVERERFKRDMVAALTSAQQSLEPLVHALVAELRALRSTNVELAKWCEWVEREARVLLDQATIAALEVAPPVEPGGLSSALDALAAAWRGDVAEDPPSPAEPAPDAEPDTVAEARAAHRASVAQAAPWSRVDTRDYDAGIYDQLVTQLAYASQLPVTPSNIGLDLVGVAGSAAAVARNADTRTFEQRTVEASILEPLAAAIALLNNLKHVANESGQTELEALAQEFANERLLKETWSEASVWEDNVLHCRALLEMTVACTDIEHVRGLALAGLGCAPLTTILVALANWSESLETLDPRVPGHPRPSIRSLPAWLPLEALEAAVRAQWTDLSEADLEGDDVARRLAAEVLAQADSP